MRIIDFTCPKCGAGLEIDEKSTSADCPYCGNRFVIDDGFTHVKFENAEQAGYEFEKGRFRAYREEKEENERVRKAFEEAYAAEKNKRLNTCQYCGTAFDIDEEGYCNACGSKVREGVRKKPIVDNSVTKKQDKKVDEKKRIEKILSVGSFFQLGFGFILLAAIISSNEKILGNTLQTLMALICIFASVTYLNSHRCIVLRKVTIFINIFGFIISLLSLKKIQGSILTDFIFGIIFILELKWIYVGKNK
ncbi:hypothetical protein SAMN06296386_101127 [Lachnospiraceae bacterium]|nr:hypothetical protein SAMN06296386_101127 [Lachnospiraceae bacterium]